MATFVRSAKAGQKFSDVVVKQFAPEFGFNTEQAIVNIPASTGIPVQIGTMVKAGTTAGVLEVANVADASDVIGIIVDANVDLWLNQAVVSGQQPVQIMNMGPCIVAKQGLLFADAAGTAADKNNAVAALKALGIKVVERV